MVALGTFLSSFWILAANSWMHTPSGFEIRDGIFHVTSWIEAIFNPSFPWRLSHMLVASFLILAFVVAAGSAWFLLCRGVGEAKRYALFVSLWLSLLHARSSLA